MNVKTSIKTLLSKSVKTSTTSRLDIEIILMSVLKKTKEFLYTNPEYKLNKRQLTKFNRSIKRRLKYEPIAYIIGEKEFYGLKFFVNKNVLIPRPTTEILVDATLKRLLTLNFGFLTVVDLGTGSGCIPIAIAKNLPKNILRKIQIYAVDNSQKALNVAKKNACSHMVDKKIKFIKNDLLGNKKLKVKNCKFYEQFQISDFRFANNAQHSIFNIIITANLPYISTQNYKNLPPDIKKYEPKQALIAGKDGLKYYRRLFKQIKLITQTPLNRGQKRPLPSAQINTHTYTERITLIIEVDSKQINSIKKILKRDFKNIKTCAKSFGFAGDKLRQNIEVIKDLAGLNRVMIINFPQIANTILI